MQFSFKEFVHKNEPKPANMVDSMWQELGIDRNSLPDDVASGPIELEDEGIIYNQAIWKIVKPIEESDKFVRIQFMKSVNDGNPNFVRAYQRGADGKLTPYQGKIDGRIHLISIQKLAQMLGLAFKASLAQGGQ